MRKYTTIDLFAGAGGLSYGFQQTGKFDVKIAVEYNKNAQDTYKKNHIDVEVESDITKITNARYSTIKAKYEKIDIVIGGPPCQGFSNANRQKNELICGNNQLVNEYIRAVEQLDPKAFVMENVKMINSSKHRFFCSEKIRKNIEKLGVELKEETIAIAEETICTADFINFLKYENDLKKYSLEQQDYIKLNTIYRNSKTLEQLYKYFKKFESTIKKIISSWENLKIEFWNNEYKRTFSDAKDNLNRFLSYGEGYEDLSHGFKVIIEMQKAIYKMQEIRDNNITLRDMSIEKNNLCVIINTYNIIEYVIKKFECMGYIVESGVLNAVNYGVPQNRERFIIIGIKKEYLKEDKVQLPQPILKSPEEFYNIKDAIEDLAKYETTVNIGSVPIKKNIDTVNVLNPLQTYLSKGEYIYNHVVTDTRDTALERFRNLRPGQNFHNLNENLKTTYSDPTRTQNTIYLRLKYETPSGTVLNVRKSMWIHPENDRAISIREAARLQSFPDEFIFCGTKDAQYQQVGNAVPPLLGRAIAEKLLELMGDEPINKLSDIIVRK